MIAEYENDVLVRKFIYGPGIDEPICMITSTATYYYHFDGLGSVVALSDANSEIVEAYTYDVYGESSNTSSVGNPYLFTGRRCQFNPNQEAQKISPLSSPSNLYHSGLASFCAFCDQ